MIAEVIYKHQFMPVGYIVGYLIASLIATGAIIYLIKFINGTKLSSKIIPIIVLVIMAIFIIILTITK